MFSKQTKLKSISVSFQEDDDSTNTTTNIRDFSTVFRRASIAPLAAKIRTNRPPTAPPGSIYLKAIEMRYVKNLTDLIELLRRRRR